MRDVQSSIEVVETAMDCFEKMRDAAGNYAKVVAFDLSSLGDELEDKRCVLQRRLEDLEDMAEDGETGEETDRISEQLMQIEELKKKHYWLNEDFSDCSRKFTAEVDDAVRKALEMSARHLRKMGGVVCVTAHSASPDRGSAGGSQGGPFYMVAIIDSAKYPESAAHIRSAIKQGRPAVLTLDRSGAAARREASLQGIRTFAGLDRDEYPPAAFLEGGSGAHVWHIDAADNRGSGSSFSWQLREWPDGTRVHFRVI